MMNKIILIIGIILISLMSVHGELVAEGVIEEFIAEEYEVNIDARTMDLTFENTMYWEHYYKSELETGDTNILYYTNVRVTTAYNWETVPVTVGGCFELTSGGVSRGSGSCYIRKTAIENVADVYFNFDSNVEWIDDTTYDMVLDSSVINYWFDLYGIKTGGFSGIVSGIHCCVLCRQGDPDDTFGFASSPWTPGKAYNQFFISFKNEYSIDIEKSIVESTITRDMGEPGKSSSYVLRDHNGNLIYSSGYSSVNHVYKHDNGDYYYYLKCEYDDIEYLIYNKYHEYHASLYSDKNTYIIDEFVEYTYTTLDKINENKDIIYDLNIYYYNHENIIHYIHTIPLSSVSGLDENTGVCYDTTSGQYPNKVYFSVIDSSLDYTNQNIFDGNKKLEAYYNVTYDYEYILDQCNGQYCEYTNNEQVNCVYFMNSQYNAKLYDHNGLLVDEYINLNGLGYLSVKIPVDNGKIYSYPNWYITLNDSSENITVYWSEILTGENGEYIPPIPDADIQDNIDELRDGVQPLKDLFFGFSSIVIDNPDYDGNGIVDVNEIDGFFNSMVPWILLLMIYILYKGLTLRR